MDDLRSDIANELIELASVKADYDKLADRETEYKNDADALELEKRENDAQLSDVTKQLAEVNDQIAPLQAQYNDWQDRRDKHNAKYPSGTCIYYGDEPSAECLAWKNEKDQLTQEFQDISSQLEPLLAQQKDLTDKQTSLRQSAEGELTDRQNELDKTKSQLDDDIDAFENPCAQYEARIRALIEVIQNPNEGITPTPRPTPEPTSPIEPFFNTAASAAPVGIGSEVVSHLFQVLDDMPALRSIETDVKYGDGAALSVATLLATADAVNADMDDQATEVAKNTYLLGAYGRALTQLKRDGRLDTNDPGYSALLSATKDLASHSPTGQASFTFQSLTTDNAVVNALQAYTASFVPISKAADASWSTVLKGSDSSIGELASPSTYATGVLFKSAASWEMSQVVSGGFDAYKDYMRERSRKAAEESLKQ